FYDAEEGPAERNGLERVLNESPWLREASLAILLEPTDLAVELGCNGSMNVVVRVPGVAAQAARPRKGWNAVTEGADWLREVARFVRINHSAVAGKQGWTDVARFTAAGVPPFNFGPCLSDMCHRADEYCPIDNLRGAYEHLAAFLAGKDA